MRKRFVVIAAVVLVAVAVVFILTRGGNKKYDFRFDTISHGDIAMYVTATGTINPVISVEVGTQVSGIISKLYADFNSIVKRGEIIAKIDSTFLVQAVRDAMANVERVRAQYADAKRVRDRTTALFEKNLESQVTYDAAVTQFESNRAALKQAEASLERAKINLAYATIYAPIDGVVIDRKVNVGQTVAASFSSPTLYTIANDLRRMQVQTTVDESDIGRISIGQEATFTVDAYPDDRFRGTVSQIRLAPLSIQNVVNYTVIIDVDNDKLKLMPGMTANTRILVGSSTNVLRVSNLALRFQPPAELVDSGKVKELRGAMSGGGDRGSRMEGEGHGMNRDFGGMGPSADAGGGDRRERMQAIRDSIKKAHGGEVSDEVMREEMFKVFQRTRGGSAPVAAPARPKKTERGTSFGIQHTFPEYQKSAYVPSRQSGRGRIWILNSGGKLEPLFVTTGLSDGRFTEIMSESAKEGDRVVIGATSPSDGVVAPASNPFMQQGQQGRGGPGR